MNLSCVIEPAVSTVNFIHSHELISSIKFFSEIKTEYPDMFYHTTIQWLSNGIVLFKFFKLRVETEIVLNKKNPPQPLLLDTEWLWKLVFASDLIIFLNEFNLKSEGQQHLKICKTYTEVKSFQGQLTLFESQVMSSCFIHFWCCEKSK